MKIASTKIDGVSLIETAPHRDERGSFSRWFCADELAPVLKGRSILHINHSKTLEKGTVRGLHFQKKPHAEIKFVRCLRGRLWDVVLDLRQGSKTFLQWFAAELSPENALMMVVPEGFAHGFQALEPDTELLYFNTQTYNPAAEGGINPEDPRAGIKWPLPVAGLSDRDASRPLLSDSFQGLEL